MHWELIQVNLVRSLQETYSTSWNDLSIYRSGKTVLILSGMNNSPNKSIHTCRSMLLIMHRSNAKRHSVFQNCGDKTRTVLLEFFNASFSAGRLPMAFKEADLIPIPKARTTLNTGQKLEANQFAAGDVQNSWIHQTSKNVLLG